MKTLNRALLLIPFLSITATAAPSRDRPLLQLQNNPDGNQLLFDNTLPLGRPQDDQQVPSLSPGDFISIQHSIKDAVVKAADFVHSILDAGSDDATSSSSPVAPLWPPHPPAIIDFSQYTILEILNASLQVKPEDKPWSPFPKPPTDPKDLPFHKLGWIVNYSVEAQKELSKEGITLLAPDDIALTHPKHRGEFEKRLVDQEAVSEEMKWAFAAEMENQLAEESEHQPLPHPFYSHHLNGHHREKKHKKDQVSALDEESRRAHISKMIGLLIQYTTLPEALTGWQIANHSTLPTSLQSGTDNPEPLRVRIEPKWTPHPIPHPTLAFNFYAYKRGFSVKAKNGIIHTISAPLFPPLSPLNQLFLFPQIFSSLTSDVQKVGLDEVLVAAPYFTEDDEPAENVEGVWNDMLNEMTKEKGGLFTVFAPTNFAFNRLGPNILAFLHTPFPLSRTILKYFLSYHIIPDITFHSDYVLNHTSLLPVVPTRVETNVDVLNAWILDSPYEVMSSLTPDGGVITPAVAIAPRWELPSVPGHSSPPQEPAHPPPPHHPPPTHQKCNVTHYELPTLLATTGVNTNATMKVAVVSFRKFGKGPIRRAIIVLPAEDEDDDEKKAKKNLLAEVGPVEEWVSNEEVHIQMMDKPNHDEKHDGPRPVKVWKADGVARNGAIHVVNSVLKPPVYHHKPSDEGEVESRAMKAFGKMRKGCHQKRWEALFA